MRFFTHIARQTVTVTFEVFFYKRLSTQVESLQFSDVLFSPSHGKATYHRGKISFDT